MAAAVTMKIGISEKQRQLAGFETVIVAERQRDEAGHQDDVPDPGQRDAQVAPIHPHAAQARHQIVALADEQIGEGAHDDAIDVDGTESTECQFQAMAEIVREGEQARNDHPDRRRDHQPEHAPIKPGSNHRPIDQRIEVDAGKPAAQRLCGMCQGAPLRGRRGPAGRVALLASVEPQSSCRRIADSEPAADLSKKGRKGSPCGSTKNQYLPGSNTEPVFDQVI